MKQLPEGSVLLNSLESKMNFYKATIVRVIGGNTVVANIDLGLDVTKRQVLHLADIHVPEVDASNVDEQKHAEMAIGEVYRLLDGESCIINTKKDHTKSIVGATFWIRADRDIWINVNEKLVRDGLAKPVSKEMIDLKKSQEVTKASEPERSKEDTTQQSRKKSFKKK